VDLGISLSAFGDDLPSARRASMTRKAVGQAKHRINS
jgi:hypothetical protein